MRPAWGEIATQQTIAAVAGIVARVAAIVRGFVALTRRRVQTRRVSVTADLENGPLIAIATETAATGFVVLTCENNGPQVERLTHCGLLTEKKRGELASSLLPRPLEPSKTVVFSINPHTVLDAMMATDASAQEFGFYVETSDGKTFRARNKLTRSGVQLLSTRNDAAPDWRD